MCLLKRMAEICFCACLKLWVVCKEEPGICAEIACAKMAQSPPSIFSSFTFLYV